MSDISVVYTLTFGGDSIAFNDGALPSFDDFYFITAIRGLDGAPLRFQQWDKPQADGGLPGKPRKGARHIVIEGEYLVQSTMVDNEIRLIRNMMDEDLLALLDGNVGVTGSLAWTPAGKAARSLAVLYAEAPLETDGVEQKTFVFGLYAANPDPT